MLRSLLAATLLAGGVATAAAAEPARTDARPVAAPDPAATVRLDDQQLDRVVAGNPIINTAGWLSFGAANIGWSIGTGVQYFLLGRPPSPP